MNDAVRTLLYTLGSVLLICLLLAVLLLALVYRRLRRLDLPPDADFWTTIRAVPFALVLGLDLLDLALDVFATPFVWVLLSRFRLQTLRNAATIVAFVPFTQALPTFTVAWFIARTFGLGQQRSTTVRRIIEAEQVGANRYVPRTRRR